MYPFTNGDYVRHVPNHTRAHDVDSVDAMPDLWTCASVLTNAVIHTDAAAAAKFGLPLVPLYGGTAQADVVKTSEPMRTTEPPPEHVGDDERSGDRLLIQEQTRERQR